MLRLVFKLSLRQAEGFLRSVLALMSVDLDSSRPHHSLSAKSGARFRLGSRSDQGIDPSPRWQHWAARRWRRRMGGSQVRRTWQACLEAAPSRCSSIQTDRMPPVEESVWGTPASPGEEFLLSLEDNPGSRAACSSSGVAESRGEDRLQPLEHADCSRQARAIRHRRLAERGHPKPPLDLCINATRRRHRGPLGRPEDPRMSGPTGTRASACTPSRQAQRRGPRAPRGLRSVPYR
jgi:hypothetical protein